MAGGSDGSKSLDSVEVYDYSTNTWTPGPSLQVPRANAGLAVLAGRLYIVGGYESMYSALCNLCLCVYGVLLKIM